MLGGYANKQKNTPYLAFEAKYGVFFSLVNPFLADARFV